MNASFCGSLSCCAIACNFRQPLGSSSSTTSHPRKLTLTLLAVVLSQHHYGLLCSPFGVSSQNEKRERSSRRACIPVTSPGFLTAVLPPTPRSCPCAGH